MRIQPMSSNQALPRFKANLHVAESTKEIIKSNEKTFMKAAEMFDNWLRHDKASVNSTMYIRRNSSIHPKMVFEHPVERFVYGYPHEDTGYKYTVMTKEYENLEFQLGDRICGFWFDNNSNEHKLLSDFKNMFNYLNK